MNYVLKNEQLEVVISSMGAEVRSVKRGGCEYIWQGGDERYWRGRTPLLFSCSKKRPSRAGKSLSLAS